MSANMPSNVLWFERLMCLAILLGLAPLFPTFRAGTIFDSDAWIPLLVAVIHAAVYVWLIWIVARRRMGWSRNVLAVLFLLSVAGDVFAYYYVPSDVYEDRIDELVALVTSTLEPVILGAALILLVTGNARA
jgi:hypothetical protein